MTLAQVILAWAVQHGTSVITKTAQLHRLKENSKRAPLSAEHFDMVDRLTIDRGTTRYLVPTAHIGFDIFVEEADQPVDDRAPWDATEEELWKWALKMQ